MSCPLYRGCLLFGGFTIRGFTVLPVPSLSVDHKGGGGNKRNTIAKLNIHREKSHNHVFSYWLHYMYFSDARIYLRYG